MASDHSHSPPDPGAELLLPFPLPFRVADQEALNLTLPEVRTAPVEGGTRVPFRLGSLRATIELPDADTAIDICEDFLDEPTWEWQNGDRLQLQVEQRGEFARILALQRVPDSMHMKVTGHPMIVYFGVPCRGCIGARVDGHLNESTWFAANAFSSSESRLTQLMRAIASIQVESLPSDA
jgi:hypothetical protein